MVNPVSVFFCFVLEPRLSSYYTTLFPCKAIFALKSQNKHRSGIQRAGYTFNHAKIPVEEMKICLTQHI